MVLERSPVDAPEAPAFTTAPRPEAGPTTGGRAERRPYMAVKKYELTRELEELIAALDRRVQRVEQAGEAAIARDAAALRAKAVARLAELAGPHAASTANDGGDAP